MSVKYLSEYDRPVVNSIEDIMDQLATVLKEQAFVNENEMIELEERIEKLENKMLGEEEDV